MRSASGTVRALEHGSSLTTAYDKLTRQVDTTSWQDKLTGQVDRGYRQRRRAVTTIMHHREETSSVNTHPKRIVPLSWSSFCRQTQMEPRFPQSVVSRHMDGRHECSRHTHIRSVGERGQIFPARHVLPSCVLFLLHLLGRVGLVKRELPLFVVWHDRCLSQGIAASKTEEIHYFSDLSLSTLHQLCGPGSIIDEDKPAIPSDKAGGLWSHSKRACSLTVRRVIGMTREASGSSLHRRVV